MASGRSWVKWVGIGCGGALLLLGGFIAAIFFVVGQATAEPEKVARAFVEATSRADFAAAHALYSAPLKERQSLQQLQEAAAATPSLYKVTDLSFSSRSVDQTGAEFKGTATLASGTTVPCRFKLVREKDAWRLIAYNLGGDD
ncbi:hypothetical protein TBR22_A23140 [Luteitalea sp. TBR-22]|uniref:hypothetical protein n=1 Tax=Luteitalea sp. TBR-22 TaxID=2802971 RepID=UPI001AF07733|nr:hypothetical protein [Luteitalea sp. TBR-22]BCS33088.1 hypothetical protein TBR22_A23140 [Luteitalea sp. TBR-22]